MSLVTHLSDFDDTTARPSSARLPPAVTVLVEARQRLDAHHHSLTIVSPTAAARRVLDLTGLTALFSVTPAPTPG